MRSFHLHSAVDIQPFSPAFPLAGYAAKASCCYSFGASKKAVLKFPADTAIRGRSSAPVFQRNILCRGDGRTSSAVKGSLRQRLTALCLARLRRPRPRFARHLAAPHPLHAALPYGGGRLQSSLTLAPPAVKGAYFSLSTVNLNRASKKKALSEYQVVLFQKNAENRVFFPNFSADGLHNRSILSVIPLEFQEIKHQPLPMAQPRKKHQPFLWHSPKKENRLYRETFALSMTF